MEKLSERIDTLKPRTSEKLKADLVDFLIYLITLIPIINIITPLYNTEDFNWFRAVIMGSLVFILINYFLRYFIPLKFKGRTIGKLLFNLQTVDYYGYEVKPGQLLLKESIYIFVPILVFSKFTYLNYGLLAMWFLFFLISVYRSYFLTKRSMKQKLKEAKEFSFEQEIPLEDVGYDLFHLLKERTKKFKVMSKEIAQQHKLEKKNLLQEHKIYLGTLQDKEAKYQANLKHKLDLESLVEVHKNQKFEISKEYDHDLLQIIHIELDKAEKIIEANQEPEPDYYPISQFVLEFPHFLNELLDIDHSQTFEVTVDEEGNKIKRTPYDELIEKYGIDQLPKKLIKLKESNVQDIKLQRTIENGNTFIIDLECRYEKINKKKNSDSKEIVNPVTPYFKTKSFKVLMFQENGEKVIHFLEPKLYGKARRRAKLHYKAKSIQSRSIMDLQANTVTVDYLKFQEFFETHRTEE